MVRDTETQTSPPAGQEQRGIPLLPLFYSSLLNPALHEVSGRMP